MIDWPDKLIEKIARRDVVILMGSGVSANSLNKDGVRPPTWFEFLSRAKDKLHKCPRYISKAISEYRYLEACEYLKSALDGQWDDIVKKCFLTPNYQPAKIHESIFNLDSRIVVSLNFDRIYDNYALSKSDGTYIIKNYWNEDVASVTSGMEKYLLKMHGTVEDTNNMIFSLKDYALARSKNRNFYRLMDALLITHTFIIVGCGLYDPDVQLMFEDNRNSFGLANHYMLTPTKMAPEEKRIIRETRGIHVITYSSKNNHEELTESLSSLVDVVSEKRNEVADLQSW